MTGLAGTWHRIEGETGDDAKIEIALIESGGSGNAIFYVKGFAKYDLPGDPDLVASVGSFEGQVEMIEPEALVHTEIMEFTKEWVTTAMRLRGDRLIVEDRNAHCAYGFNVTFTGVYRRFGKCLPDQVRDDD